MNLDRVTMTGADDSITNPADLWRLSQEFPFVEWGILVSQKLGGSPRYPSQRWISDLQGVAEAGCCLDLSLHVCGRWVRDLLVGDVTLPLHLLHCFARVQLNFHAERTECRPITFAEALASFGAGKQFIFQFDGASGNEHLDDLYDAADCRDKNIDSVALFDVSGGAGIVPAEWPKPYYMSGPATYAYHGYAGGLGPDTLVRELPRIAEAAGDCRIWIDMETRVRSAGDRLFDLNKVRRCLEICQPFVKQRNHEEQG